MTTLFNFTPSAVAPYSFQPTLDGAVYNAVVTWNLFGRRYYLNLYQLDGTLVACEALVGSPTGVVLQGISWASGLVTATTAQPHGYAVTATVELTVSGCSPDAYNGTFGCLIMGFSTFTYPLATAPLPATVLGAVAYDIDLVDGYFATSSLVFRDGSQQFEVADLPTPVGITGVSGGSPVPIGGPFILGQSILGGPNVLL